MIHDLAILFAFLLGAWVSYAARANKTPIPDPRPWFKREAKKEPKAETPLPSERA
jgi:hypothetical protein